MRRRAIESEHVRFVEAHRHRMSWQAMALACGVNQHDLRRQCDRAYAAGLNAPTAPKAAAPAPVKPMRSVEPISVLRAIAHGAMCAADISSVLRCSRKELAQPIDWLKRRGWLAGSASGRSGWVLTAAGQGALRNAKGSDR